MTLELEGDATLEAAHLSEGVRTGIPVIRFTLLSSQNEGAR